MAAHQKGLTLPVPKARDVLLAMAQKDPKSANEEQTSAMDFLLNVALPAVDPKLTKNWIKGKSTTIDTYKGRLPMEIATAAVLIEKFSDTDNLLYNAGLVDSEGNPIDLNGGRPIKPEKKRRKKIHTKVKEGELTDFYYAVVNHVDSLMALSWFADSSRTWDKICCADRGAVLESVSASRANTVPLCHRGDDQPSSFSEFFSKSKLGFHWSQMDNLSSSSSASVSTSGDDNMPPLPSIITQQEV